MLIAKIVKRNLIFKKPAITSRDVLTQKTVYLLLLKNKKTEKIGIGECTFIQGLSFDNERYYQKKLKWLQANIHLGEAKLKKALVDYPSIVFGLEMAFISLKQFPKVLYPSVWNNPSASGVPDSPLIINGLVWIGDYASMEKAINELLKKSFRCIKLKVGALHFNQELALIKMIRERNDKVIIRLDANGAWGKEKPTLTKMKKIMHKLEQLEKLKIHSIEQPIQKNNLDLLTAIIKESPIPIALDEELIGFHDLIAKKSLLEKIQPHYLVLKASLLGGVTACLEWISLAEKLGIKWWATSALESSWGLSYIAQWVASLKPKEIQGLGTGSIYENNFPSSLRLENDELYFDATLYEKNLLALKNIFN